MNELHRRFDDFQKRALELDARARKSNGRLFLFDQYCPKHIPAGIDDEEVIFWFLIVDLYGLFFDAGKYLRYVPVWNNPSKTNVIHFYEALNEIRSAFCHNKPPTSYLSYHVTNPALGRLAIEWTKKSASAKELLTRKFTTDSPFRDLFDIYMQAAEKFLVMLEIEVLATFEQHVANNRDDSIYKEWFIPIFKWYCNNPVVYTRAWQSFYRENNPNDYHMDQKVAVDAKKIQRDLVRLLSNCDREKYGRNMYYRHFSLHATTSNRRELTPFTLFEPLLSALRKGIKPII